MSDTHYMMKAYHQEHFTKKEELLDHIRSEFGEGKLLDFHSQMCDKYGMPKLGTTRCTYISKTCVFKVPTMPCGFRLNDWEGSLISMGSPGEPWYIPLAKSKAMMKDDINICVMELVQPLTLDEIKDKFGEIPNFVSAVDMGQVGLNRKNELVAFDYADL